ncbi:glycosyltransferase family A protein [Bacteroides hominis]|uniref:glycosyltransferase family A protein n=1 Tax=Bacteroides hominis TaxID=2763023 RepID=UPI00164B2D12|nr:glycosyltransferase family 2 protein [Bacteroides hominis (ex Liu et al. 2022)]MBC5613371.1 glycosyltransferase family 2 protein [Bacteroides hominis (ex Liu et al. 2022)]MCS2830357.1 glycosyltransferase family 2 protein [Bacteroides fragilis]
MPKYTVSIILPTYNPGNYIYDCLYSIYNQSLDKSLFELIIVLNGDYDPYYSLISSFLVDKCDRLNFRILYSMNKGVSNARNVGLSIAEGEYICFIDDDDIISQEYLSGLLKYASKSCITICNVRSFLTVIGDKSPKFFLDNYLNNIIENTHIYSFYRFRSILSVPWGKLIHKDIISDRCFNTGINNGEDALFITSLTNKVSYLTISPNASIYWVRIRKGSASRKKISILELCENTFYLWGMYIKMYFSDCKGYNLLFIISRIPGVMKNMFILLKNSF